MRKPFNNLRGKCQMSKKSTVYCRGQKYDVEEVGGTLYIHRTPTPDPGARGVQSFQPSELIFSGSDEEANCIAQAILTVTGHSKPLAPIEKVTLATPEKAPTE